MPVDKGEPSITVCGTGRATREFLFAANAAEGIVLAAERYGGEEPVNLGAGFEICIKDRVPLIVKLADFRGEIVWDSSKPDGQPCRMLDVSRAERRFGFIPKTLFEEGLRRTIEWYRAIRQKDGKRRGEMSGQWSSDRAFIVPGPVVLAVREVV